ncbi:hypothetical protein [Deinococcus sp.]|uniref:hypothetical protein n=1 Tax=Deinococcus sp. TaxID=47478 RepID=UPI0025C063BE|nr:hypothetical protein [Deinococcus sp.]
MMKTSTAQPTPQPTYTPPKVQNLGRWQAVTLIYSLPIGPGTSGLVPTPTITY